MRRFARRHPFLLVGFATFGLFLIVESMPASVRTTPRGAAFIELVGVLASPLWLMRTIEMMLGMGTWPGILEILIALPLLFAPYLLLDWVLARVRASGPATPPHN